MIPIIVSVIALLVALLTANAAIKQGRRQKQRLNQHEIVIKGIIDLIQKNTKTSYEFKMAMQEFAEHTTRFIEDSTTQDLESFGEYKVDKNDLN